MSHPESPNNSFKEIHYPDNSTTDSRLFRRLFHISIIILSTIGMCTLWAADSDSAKHWVGTWGCSPYPMGDNNSDMPPAIANNTVRQVVRVSIGGDTVRIRFSNKTCKSSVTMNAVNIAVSPDGTKSPVTGSTITPLKFGGNTSVTINAGAIVASDPVAFALTPSMRVAITIYYGTAGVGSDLTGHVASRTDSYVASGDQSTNATFTGSVKTTTHWLHIMAMEVLADTNSHAVACLGNSITDGYGLSGGLQNRWTDAFSIKLLANAATANVGVLNEGIGATNVASGLNCGINRYQQDVLEQSGVKWLIIFYGVNDINAGASASTITNAYKTMITAAHAKNMKVYGATITPFKGNSYYSTAHEAVRQDINKWVRAAGNFDAFIDFDKAMQDPNDPAQYLAAYKNDGLHPNAAGYKALGESVDLSLFFDSVATKTTMTKEVTSGSCTINTISANQANGSISVAFTLPRETSVSMQVYSMLGTEVMKIQGRSYSSGNHTMELKNANLTKGSYIYSMTAGDFVVSGKMIVLR